MTDKRFEINSDMTLDNNVETYELSCIVDNSNKTFYFVVDSIANVESFVERLNELSEENEQLKNRLKVWHQKTFKAHEYFNILEKVIDEVCNDDISNQIWKEYEKREKLIE